MGHGHVPMVDRVSKHKRSGSMGPVFAKMLAAYEECESALVGCEAIINGLTDPEASVPVRINVDKLGQGVGALMDGMHGSMSTADYITPLIHRWANDARQLRSAFKFKMSHQDMHELADFENPDLVMRLPFEECVLVVTGVAEDAITAICLFAEERHYLPETGEIMPDWYDDNNIAHGDKFICVTASFVSGDGSFMLLPAEYHATMNRPLDGPRAGTWCTAVPKGTPDATLDNMEKIGAFMFVMLGGWIASINNPNHEVEQTQGLKPGVKHRAPRHKERRFYEHKMVIIDPLKAHVIGGTTGHGAKHRLHPVRGFWRRYKKSGKTVWVSPHWRGDKELGVITHDYEVKHGDMQNRKLRKRNSVPHSSRMQRMLQRVGVLARKITGAQATQDDADTSIGITDGVHDRSPEGPSTES